VPLEGAAEAPAVCSPALDAGVVAGVEAVAEELVAETDVLELVLAADDGSLDCAALSPPVEPVEEEPEVSAEPSSSPVAVVLCGVASELAVVSPGVASVDPD
jgi:hypothetical protein